MVRKKSKLHRGWVEGRGPGAPTEQVNMPSPVGETRGRHEALRQRHPSYDQQQSTLPSLGAPPDANSTVLSLGCSTIRPHQYPPKRRTTTESVFMNVMSRLQRLSDSMKAR